MRRLNWGLIGCGDIAGKRVAPVLRDLDISNFIAVNRSRFEMAESFAGEFGADKWYETYQELLHDEEIEAVYIATPVYQHAAQTIAAAEAGKHVLCEKPMALNSSDCRRMIDTCRANKVKLGVAYYRRFYPIIRRIKRIIHSGEIGTVITTQINAFERLEMQPDNPRYWFLEKQKSGGGPMMDFGCHRIEVLINLLGPITDTKGTAGNIYFKNREVEDTAAAVFQFGSGSIGILNVSHAISEAADSLDIYATEGSIHVPVLNGARLEVASTKVKRSEEHPPPGNAHLPLIKEFTLAVMNDREPEVGGETGLSVQEIEEAIYKT